MSPERPNRENEAYAAGRLAGFEEGLDASRSRPAGELDVESLAKALGSRLLDYSPPPTTTSSFQRRYQFARLLAAEYARLRQETPDREGVS